MLVPRSVFASVTNTAFVPKSSNYDSGGVAAAGWEARVNPSNSFVFHNIT